MLILVSVVYVAITPVIFERLDPVTGDEPFYLMTGFSLLRDGDLDESNNYAQRDYDEIFPSQPLPDDWRGWTRLAPSISPHEAVTDREGQYTKHGLGLPLLVALPYEWFGRVGAVSIVLAAAIALAGQMYLLARQSTASSPLAAAIALGLALTMPIMPYSHLLFPEVPSALLLLYAIRRVASLTNTPAQWLLTGSAIGFLPWLHQRFAITSAILTVVVLIQFWRRWDARNAIAVLLPVAIGGVSLIAFNLWLYTFPVQPPENHDGFNDLTGTVNGAFGLLLDAQWGLWIVAPLMLLAIAALPWWWEADRDTFQVAALALTPYLFLLAFYSAWWGSWGPPARYLVPVVPLAAAPLAAWLGQASWRGRVAAGAVWGASAILTVVGLDDPQRFYHQPNGHNNIVGTIDDALGTNIADRLVAFQTLGPSPVDERIIAGTLGVAALAIAFVAINILPRREPLSVNARAGALKQTRHTTGQTPETSTRE